MAKERFFKNRNYINLNEVYPDQKIEGQVYSINKFTLSESEIAFQSMRSEMNGNSWLTRGLMPSFEYVRLVKSKEGVMMSDTPMERNTNHNFLCSAHGDVLIFGLGLGLIILPLLKDSDVKSITVIELYQDLIDIVEPILSEHDVDNKLNIIQGDCFEYHNEIPKDTKYDCIYGDIWIDISTSNYDEMKQLNSKYRGKLNRDNPKSFIDHWLKDFLVREIRKEKRLEKSYSW